MWPSVPEKPDPLAVVNSALTLVRADSALAGKPVARPYKQAKAFPKSNRSPPRSSKSSAGSATSSDASFAVLSSSSSSSSSSGRTSWTCANCLKEGNHKAVDCPGPCRHCKAADHSFEKCSTATTEQKKLYRFNLHEQPAGKQQEPPKKKKSAEGWVSGHLEALNLHHLVTIPVQIWGKEFVGVLDTASPVSILRERDLKELVGSLGRSFPVLQPWEGGRIVTATSKEVLDIRGKLLLVMPRDLWNFWWCPCSLLLCFWELRRCLPFR